MALRTADDVAMMEDELRELRSISESQARRIVVADAEVARLKVENVLLQRKADDSLEKAVKVETIMMQVASGLMAGLKEMKDERDLTRTMRRQAQEDRLAEDTGAAPSFLRRPIQADPAPPEERDAVVAPRHSGRPVTFNDVRPGKVDPNIAGRDSRLPAPPAFSQTDDERSLQRLADDMDMGGESRRA